MTGEPSRNAVVIAADADLLYSLLVYRWDAKSARFVERWRKCVGTVGDLEVIDTNQDGKAEVCFGLEAQFPDSAKSRFMEFLPQGAHLLVADPVEEFRTLSVEESRRLRLDSSTPPEHLFVNLGYETPRAGRGPEPERASRCAPHSSRCLPAPKASCSNWRSSACYPSS